MPYKIFLKTGQIVDVNFSSFRDKPPYVVFPAQGEIKAFFDRGEMSGMSQTDAVTSVTIKENT